MNVADPTNAVVPITCLIFGATYICLALGKAPGLRIDRAGIALVGAAAILGFRVLSFEEAAAAVDLPTIVLLLGMMIVAGYLRISGFFSVLSRYIAARELSPRALLGATIAASGILSAFLVNDVVCVALTPLVLELCRGRKLHPTPYLIGLATASNIGSTATITGNPQNIIIGGLSKIPYAVFAARLAPIALIGLVIEFVLLSIVYAKHLKPGESNEITGLAPQLMPRSSVRIHQPLLLKCFCVTSGMIVFFFSGGSIAVIALAAAAILLLDRVRVEKVYRLVDWPLLVMFVGLFVVVHAFEVHVIHGFKLQDSAMLRNSPVVMLSVVSVVLSNIVSNVPAVLLFKPLIEAIPQNQTAWLALAMSSTLAGNLTMLGSIANLIVVESARRARVDLGFGEFLKIGVPLTLATTVVGVLWLSIF